MAAILRERSLSVSTRSERRTVSTSSSRCVSDSKGAAQAVSSTGGAGTLSLRRAESISRSRSAATRWARTVFSRDARVAACVDMSA